MPYKKEGNFILEYKVIPEHEQLIRRFTQEEFDVLIQSLDEQSKADPIKLGQDIISSKQAKLAEMQTAKMSADSNIEPMEG